MINLINFDTDEFPPAENKKLDIDEAINTIVKLFNEQNKDNNDETRQYPSNQQIT